MIRPPEPVTVSAWNERERVLPQGSTSRPGRFRALCYQRRPMDDVLSRDVAVSVWMVASQMFKTEALNSVISYHIAHDPCAQMLMYPTLESAEEWSKKKFETCIRATPALTRCIRMGSRDAGNTIRSKSYPGGHLTAVGANSPSGLRQRSARVVIGDEIDACDTSAGEEGDPVELLFRRAETFPDSIKILSSTPTIKGRSRIESWFNKSDQMRWFAVCPRPGCGVEQTLKWSQVKWPENTPEHCYYECEGCKAEWDDAERIRAIEAGDWHATAPFHGIRGFHLSGIYSLLPASRGYGSRLHQMAAEFLRANAGGKQSLRVWKNTFLAETDEEHEGDSLPAGEIYQRREHYECAPLGVLCITAGVDVQINRLECEFVGWGIGEESWGLEKLIIRGHPRSSETWRQLDIALSRSFRRADGTLLRVCAAGVDSGKWPQWVYPFVKARQAKRIHAFKGASDPAAPVISVAKKSGVDRVRLFMVGTNAIKAQIYARLAQGLEGDGACHFPRGKDGQDILGYDETHFEQLTVERMGTRFVRGQPVTVFWKNDHERNEALDIRVYATAALALFRPSWPALAARHPVIESPEPGEEKKPVAAPVRAARPRGQSFATSWMR